jgi:hypothetical protein
VLDAQTAHALEFFGIPADVSKRNGTWLRFIGGRDGSKELQKIGSLAEDRLAGGNIVEELPVILDLEWFDSVVALEG